MPKDSRDEEKVGEYMAFYSLYKWYRPWSKIKCPNMILLYRNKLFEDWFKTLTPEQQKIYLEQREKEKEKRRQSVIKQLAFLGAMMDGISDRTGFDYRRMF